MSFFTQLKRKLKKALSKYSLSSAKKKTSTEGFRALGLGDGTKSTRLCLSCQAVWVRAPFELCISCELSPYVLPFTFEEEESAKKGDDGKDEIGEVGGAPSGECEAQGKSTEEGPTLDNILKGDFPKEIGEGFSWKD
ncbi:hypothetical protein C7212DRAFT_312853 [Tuber magnatum]|uniref:Uncharacterized protein n=1 Tax=Tuber magnatum TaxID=42249 RepID=A0A317SW10_9PEZI|nr:hypothetical protein C7212DRAFT_312853 [Tuber magnatum]